MVRNKTTIFSTKKISFSYKHRNFHSYTNVCYHVIYIRSIRSSYGHWKETSKMTVDMHSFDNSVNDIKDLINYFQGNNQKWKWKNKKKLSKKLKSIETFVNIDRASAFVTLSVTEIRLIFITISIRLACVITIENKS